MAAPIRSLLLAAGGLVGAVIATVHRRKVKADVRTWQEATSDTAR